MDSFQVTLPSNASAKTFPQNRPAHYETDLMTPLHLEGPWEVSLIDIMYPHSWLNLTTKINVVIAFGLAKGGYQTIYESKFEIRPQYFESPEMFCQRMTKWCNEATGFFHEHALWKDKQGILFSYDALDDRISITSDVLVNDDVRIYICYDDKNTMEQMLGMSADERIEVEDFGELSAIELRTRTKALGYQPPEFANYPLMFVYTNLIDYQLIGDVKAPILSVLPVRGKPGDQVYWSCNPQSFIPVAKSEIRTVEIRLCTETGETFPIIGNGKVITRLNFRRRLV